MTTYKELLAQRQVLEQQISEAREAELSDAVVKVRALVKEYGLTADDVFLPASVKRVSKPAEIRYRDPATGATWSGRGREPRWLVGQDRAQFTV
jgi:DNA-binding protein H-NS